MPTVKFTYPYPDWPLLRQTPGSSGQWEDFTFRLNDPACVDADYWVVVESLPGAQEACCPRGRCVFVTWEPPSVRRYSSRFLRQFDAVITCQRRIRHPGVHYSQQGHPWFVGRSYDQLAAQTHVPKSRPMSLITSTKVYTQGHRDRLEFCMKLARRYPQIDLFGRGIRDFEDKWDVLAPYRYSIAIENEACDDWMTEKLCDCYLAHCLPLYFGCPNVEKYFNPESMLLLPMQDFDAACRVVERALSDERLYDDRLGAVLQAKSDYLNRHSLFPLLTHFLRTLGPAGVAARRHLRPEATFSSGIGHRLARLGAALAKLTGRAGNC